MAQIINPGVYGYSWNTIGRNPGIYFAVCHCVVATDVCIPAVFPIELRAQDNDDVFGEIAAQVDAAETALTAEIDANETKIDTIDTNVDTLITRVPGEVAQKSHLVNGTGDITPPTNKGIWDALGDGSTSLNDLVIAVAGANKCTLTVQDGDTNPVANVDVWITSDADGNVIVSGPLQTDVSGEIDFYLDDATYYIWPQKIGYDFTEGESWVVSGATNKTITATETGATESATYCSYEDVEKLLQVDFGASGKPTAQDVDDLIVMVEDLVDNDFSSPDALKSWKEHTETDLYFDYSGVGPLYLGRKDIRLQTDVYLTDGKLYYFNGTDFSDYWTEGDDEDLYVDYENGIVYFHEFVEKVTQVGLKSAFDLRLKRNVKCGFKWGAASVPDYIKLATAIRTAIMICTNDDYADVFISADGRVQTSFKVAQLKREYDALLKNYRDVN